MRHAAAPVKETDMDYIEFQLIDPRQISGKGDEGATVMIIGAQYQGSYEDDVDATGGLPMRQRVRLLNGNLSNITHLITYRRGIEHKVGGKIMFAYCSLCGSKFNARGCKTCQIKFTLNEAAMMGRNHPNIPPKVVKYAISHGHKF